jgi:hypothetical protein
MRRQAPERPVRRNRIGALAALAMLALAAAARAAAAEAPPENPHGAFREDCSLCHGPKAWKPARISKKFDHGKYGFPLTGAHAAAACASCHKTLDFTMAQSVCATCHEDVHRGEFGTDCAQCHTTRSFIDPAGMVRMHQTTRFPLSGAHAALDCERCHAGTAAGQMEFVGIPAECESCHMRDYNATTSPAHAASGFPLNCSSCHNSLSWTGARFDHSATAFPLTGAHRTVACQSCHGDGVWAGKSTACVSCHQGDYNGTTDPNHATLGYSTDCASCHTTVSWSGATFDHSTTGFPLTGAHLAVSCIGCHADGVYAGKSTACVSCHQTDYDGTADPGHAAAGLSTDCASCHTTTDWSGATFAAHDASYFPIYSGRHAGTWSSCATCHTSATAFTVFTCLTCHPHDSKTQTDSNHSGVSGYVYDSNACYSCHPRGRAG